MSDVCASVFRATVPYAGVLPARPAILLALARRRSHAERTARTQRSAAGNVERALKDYGDNVLRLAYSYVHNTADAEDVLQETMIAYVTRAPVFENADHEKAWLLRVAINAAKNKIRYNRVRTSDELHDDLIAEEQEDLAFVWEAVRELPEAQRETIHLYYQEGYSTSEIAHLLDSAESTVRSNLSRARTTLKEILKEAYDFEQELP